MVNARISIYDDPLRARLVGCGRRGRPEPLGHEHGQDAHGDQAGADDAVRGDEEERIWWRRMSPPMFDVAKLAAS